MPRRWTRILLGVAVALLLAAGFLAQQALRVRGQLLEAADLAERVETAVRAGESPDLAPLRRKITSAVSGTDGPAWRVGEALPWLGTDLESVRVAARALDELSRDALPPLERGFRTLKQGQVVADGRVDLALLSGVHRDLLAARPAVAKAHRDVRGLQAHVVDGQLSLLQDKLARLADVVGAADSALAKAPELLGVHGERRYLLAVQNNAEARATGGLIGVVAELQARDGRLRLLRTLTDDQLRSARPPVPDDPAAARTWVSIGSTIAWFDANLTPHGPDAGRNVAGLWRAQTGRRVDGVVFVDAVAMQRLVRSPISLPGGSSLAPEDVIDFVCRREYVDFPDQIRRKLVLRTLATAVFDSATQGGDFERLVDLAGSGHLMAWLARTDEQALLADRRLGGALPSDGSAYLEVLTQNFGGNKLDYFLHRTVTVRREREGLRVTVELRNEAPLGLPDYITVRSDLPVPPVPYGQAKVGLSLYGGKGARFEQPTLNGRPVVIQQDVDHGLGFATVEIEVPRARTTTISVLLRGPSGPLTYRQQPLVRPDRLDIDVPHSVRGE